MQNWKQTVISQYQNSPVILALLESLNAAIDPGVDLEMFYNSIWNIKTAAGYGLDVWGRMVGVTRFVNMGTSHSLGYATGFYPFTEAPWYDKLNINNNYALSDEAYRLLILFKSMANVSDCDIPTLNKMITFLFANRGVCYVRDDGGMLMTYVFEFPLTEVEVAILTQSGAVSKPTGVAVQFVYPSEV